MDDFIEVTKRTESVLEINPEYLVIYEQWKHAVIASLTMRGVTTANARHVDYKKYNVPIGKYELDESHIVEQYRYKGKEVASIVAYPFTYAFYVFFPPPQESIR